MLVVRACAKRSTHVCQVACARVPVCPQKREKRRHVESAGALVPGAERVPGRAATLQALVRTSIPRQEGRGSGPGRIRPGVACKILHACHAINCLSVMQATGKGVPPSPCIAPSSCGHGVHVGSGAFRLGCGRGRDRPHAGAQGCPCWYSGAWPNCVLG